MSAELRIHEDEIARLDDVNPGKRFFCKGPVFIFTFIESLLHLLALDQFPGKLIHEPFGMFGVAMNDHKVTHQK